MTQAAFRYLAVDRRGSRTKGVLRAETQNEAYRQVRAAGLQPLDIKQVKIRSGRSKRVTIKDLAHVTYQFAVLMEARIPMIDGLRAIAEQESNPRLREVLSDIAGRISAGNSVTDAISAYREVFGEVY